MNGPQSASKPDDELWLALKTGSKSAHRVLFLRHHDSLYQYGLALCSNKPVIEDCLQELFFQLWEKHKTLSDVKNVKGYLWISFRRSLIKRLQKSRAKGQRTTSYFSDIEIASSAERLFIDQEQSASNYEILDHLLKQLSTREREVLFLKYYEGMSYSEIEEILGLKYQTVRNYVHRAIMRLRNALDEEGLKIIL